MNKMNKKGFTLIEMLVVIAIIAVLVSIVIPTVSSATGKAKAATDAANLRSLLAEATTDYLNGQDDKTGMVSYTAASKTFAVTAAAPKSESFATAVDAVITVTNDVISCTYDGYGINDFALVAEKGGELAKTGK